MVAPAPAAGAWRTAGSPVSSSGLSASQQHLATRPRAGPGRLALGILLPPDFRAGPETQELGISHFRAPTLLLGLAGLRGPRHSCLQLASCSTCGGDPGIMRRRHKPGDRATPAQLAPGEPFEKQFKRRSCQSGVRESIRSENRVAE